MRQSIGEQQENKMPDQSRAAIFHGSAILVCGFKSFRARRNGGLAVSTTLLGGVVLANELSLLRPLAMLNRTDFSPQRTRRRTLPHIKQFCAEEPLASSALAVLAVNPNKCGAHAVANVTTTMTEQRRCAAA